MFKKVLRYIVELAKYDLDYDIRDRARIFEKLLPCQTSYPRQEEGTSYLLSCEGEYTEAVGKLFRKGIPQVTCPNKNIRFYLPGSLSHVVLHAAPGYSSLPKPCSVHDEDLKLYSDIASGANVPAKDIIDKNSSDSNDPQTSSGSSFEESGSNYDSEHSDAGSVSSEGSRLMSDSNGKGHTDSLLSIKDQKIPSVQFSDAGVSGQTARNVMENISTSYSSGLAEMMPNSTLESWLDEQPSLSSEQKSQQSSSARVSFNDLRFIIKPKLHMLLDPVNGNGLKVEYSFSSEVSTVSPLLLCIEVFFSNHSTEQMKNIYVKDAESDGTMESANLVLEKYERCATAPLLKLSVFFQL